MYDCKEKDSVSDLMTTYLNKQEESDQTPDVKNDPGIGVLYLVLSPFYCEFISK